MTPAVPVPVVLVGCGAVAQQFYLPALRTLQRAGELQVHALVDPADSARAALTRVFPRATASAALETVEAPRGALAIVASPPRFHASQTIAALNRGWHVLCEKPFATDSAEAAQMLAAATRQDRLLAAGLYKRFFPASRYLRGLCRDQLLGPLLHFSIAEGGPFRWPAASRSFFDRSQSSGGVLADIGVHVLDLVAWCLGLPTEIAYADDAMGGLETNARVELGFVDGARGTIHLSRDWQTAQRYTFVFERGIVRWNVNDASGLTVQLSGSSAALNAHLDAPLNDAGGTNAGIPPSSNAHCFIAQLRNLTAAIAGAEPLQVPGTEALLSLRLIEACYEKRQLLDQPWLTPAESARAAALAAAAVKAPAATPPPLQPPARAFYAPFANPQKSFA